MLAKMISIAAMCHEEQYDKAGQPYILHPLKVMELLNTNDEELQCIAVGHDLIEDCYPPGLVWHKQIVASKIMSWKAYLINIGFSDRIISAIVALTKIKGETNSVYKTRVMNNPDAIKVKMADLRHNSDITRLRGITEKDLIRIQKYYEFYMELKNVDIN